MKLSIEAHWDSYTGEGVRTLRIGRYRAEVARTDHNPEHPWSWQVYQDDEVREGSCEVDDDMIAMRESEGAIIGLHFDDDNNSGEFSAVPSFSPPRSLSKEKKS